VTYHARIGFRRCGASPPQLSSGPLGGAAAHDTESQILHFITTSYENMLIHTIHLSTYQSIFRASLKPLGLRKEGLKKDRSWHVWRRSQEENWKAQKS
jgi:hypothetical protein